MKDRPVLVAIVLLLLVLGAFATPAISAAVPEIGCKNKNYFAKDSVNEPGVERGHFKYDNEETSLDYDLKILTDETFLDGSIHIRAQNNPPVLDLDYTQGWSTLTEDDLLPPYEGLTFHYLRLLMDYNMTYLNLTVETEEGTKEVLAPIFNNGVCILSDSLIMGVVFYDEDGDGIFDAGEYGIEGIEVSVANGETDTKSTDGSGMFLFSVYPGPYTVSVDPDGYNNTTPTEVPVDVPIGAGAFVFFGLNGTPPTPQPAIDIEKSTNEFDADDAPGPSIPVGESVAWTYVVNNTGNVDLENIAVTDDKEVTVTCPSNILLVGENMTCTASGTAIAGQYTNTGNVTAEYDEMSVSDEDMSHYFGTTEGPAIHIEKYTNGEDADDAPGPSINVGSSVTWTYNVTNIGTVTLSDINITDDVLGNICTISSLAPGATNTCTVTGTAEPGQYSNLGTASVEYDSTIYTDTDPSHYYGTSPGEPTADLNISKTASVTTAKQNEEVTWTITVTNNGPDPATNVTVIDDISGLIDVTIVSTTPDPTSGTTWNLGTLENGTSATVTIVTKFSSLGEKTNNVTVMSEILDPDTTDNSDAASVTIVKPGPPEKEADLNITKEHSDGTFYPNDLVTWTVTVSNEGPHSANTSVQDYLDPDGTIVNFSVTQGTFDSAKKTWSVGELKNKDTAVLILNTTFSSAGWKWNNVSVTSDRWDPDTINNNASDSVYILPSIQEIAAIDVEKYVLVNRSGEWVRYDGEFMALSTFPVLFKNEPFKWEIWVENNGTVPLELNWTDNYNGTALDLSKICPEQLEPGTNASCFIDDNARADDQIIGLPFNATLLINEVSVEGKYEDLKAMDEDYAAYLGVDSLFGVKKFVLYLDTEDVLQISDADTPPGPKIHRFADPVSSLQWAAFAWNFHEEPANLTWTDTLNGDPVNLSEVGASPGIPDSIDSFDFKVFFWEDETQLGLNCNNITVYADYETLDDITASDLAYYTGMGVIIEKYVWIDGIRYDADALEDFEMTFNNLPFVEPGSSIEWEIYARNPDDESIDIVWHDLVYAIPFDFSAEIPEINLTEECSDLPGRLGPGDEYSCTFDDTAFDGLFINYVLVTDESENWLGYDTAGYFGTEKPFGAKKFIITSFDPEEANILDANEPPGPGIPVGDEFMWVFFVWNLQEEAAGLTWDDDYNGTMLDTTGFPASIDSYDFTGFILPDTAVQGLFYNNVTVNATYATLDDDSDSDIAYYTGYYPAPYATVKGFVFNDTDADGAWNKSFESGLPGANVTIANATWSASVTTGPDGNFTLHVPATGDYVITETNPEGYVSTNAIPGDGATKWDNDNLNISIAAFTVYDDHLFGDVLQGSVAVLAGRVFDDMNETGTWDAGESGLPGVNVTMEIQDNPMPITVKTNATGEYQFAVLPGTNARISSDGPGGDYYPTTPESLYLTPPSAGLYKGNDFGYSDDEVAVIFGIVFNDINSDGEQGLGESGLPGANVTFDGTTSVITTCIDLTCGRFTFVTEDTGIHSVHEENPSGYRSTTPDEVNVPVAELGRSYGISFGDTNRTDTASIYGTVFDDCNGNGVQDADEQGIEGVRVNLTDASGMEILNTTTKEYGQYTFGISDPGVYNVVEQDPAKEGYRSTTPDRVVVQVALNESYLVNFGDTDCTGFSTIMGTVFEDINRDGTFNWSELGIRDVTVNLSSGDSTSTDGYGSYSFKVVTPGQVNVTETDPAGYESTTPNVVPVDVTLNEPYTVNFGDAKEAFATITACKKDDPGNNLSGWKMNIWREEDGYYRNGTTEEDGCTVFTVEIGSIYKLFESQKEGWRAIEPEDGTMEPIHHAHYEVNVTEPGDYRYTFVNEEVLEPNVYVYACKNDTSGTPLIGWAMMLSVDGGGPVYQSGMTDDTGCTVFTLEYAETQITAQLEEVRKPGWENVTDWKYGFTINEPGTYNYTFVNRLEGEEKSTIKAIAYRDNNRNGVQDLPSETGLAGVTFTLRLDDDQIGQKITDSSGTVSFTNLEADTYRLSAAPPSSRWYLTSGSSARDVTVGEDSTVEEKFGYRYRGGPGPGPTPKPTPPEVGAAPECDFYENGTLTINEDGLNLETIVICALDGIGKLIVYDGVTALNPLGEPLEWATIVVIPGAPDAGERYTFMGTAYNCSPNKATFDSPITLLMEYGEYQWAELSGKNLVIMRWDAETGEWTKLPTTINENERAVFADVTELGIFALFVEGPPVVESPPETPVTIIVLQYYWWILAVILLGTISFITLMAHRENEKAL